MTLPKMKMKTTTRAQLTTHTVVIGSGPGGYPCAIRLGQLGIDTIMVEKASIGGVCLNVGCIPSKALIAASKLVERVREAETMGITVGNLSVDLTKMMAWKGGIVGKLTGGVAGLVEANGARIVRGHARFRDATHVVVTDAEGGETEITFKNAVIATGSAPATIPGFAFDGVNILSSTEALAFETAPAKLAVVGGGYIGMEMGGVWQRLGTEVTVIEFADRILPGFEADLGRFVTRRFKKSGGIIRAGVAAKSWAKNPKGGVTVTMEDRKTGAVSTLDVDAVLLTVGRTPTSGALDLDRIGVATDARGIITVDGAQRTNITNIYAVGDVAGEPMLAHKATKEGEVAAEVIAGLPSAFDCRAIPAVVFTDPEIATAGWTKAQAETEGHTVKVGRFSFAANGRALSLNEAEGFVRVVIDAESEVILGVEVVGPEASNIIAEAALALEMGAVASDIGQTIHAHPTLAEAIMEATNAALGHAIHALNR